MFNNLNHNQGGDEKAVDDIFAETEHPVQTRDIKTQSAGLSAQTNEEDDYSHGNKSQSQKTKMILILALAIIILGVAVYLVYTKLMQSAADNDLVPSEAAQELKTTKEPVVEPPLVVENDNIIVPQSEDLVTPAAGQPIVPEKPPIEIDSDSDGLTDDNEATLKTNPLSADTDGDGLTDYQEVITFNTNPNSIDSDGDGLTDYEEVAVYNSQPLIVDTDGDGYADGEEVKNGYNPAGEGMLGNKY